ncbi:hypothetical protein bthur0013_21370 [Bacillus thuringiensis IBL 200]|nr:hypothetical protein bthur0013_21370 [Bacillus thuringiensis IBL 200]
MYKFCKGPFDRLLISLPEEISLVVNLPTFLVYYESIKKEVFCLRATLKS